MRTVLRRGETPQEQATRDNTIAAAVRNADLIEYLAMMSDIDIPTDEEGTEDEQEV